MGAEASTAERRASTGRWLTYVAVFVLAWNIVATAVAIQFNWPAQLGGVGTDAGEEFLVRGTAISAPLPPVLLLLLTIGLARRADRWQWAAVVSAGLVSVSMIFGSTGEMLAAPTEDVPQAVLLFSGITGISIGAVFLAVAVAVARNRRQPLTARELSA